MEPNLAAKQFKKNLQQRLELHDCLPFLFIGSGLTRRYLNLPNWTELLESCSSLCGKPLDYYNQRAKSDKPQTASLIAKDYFSIWWKPSNISEQKRWKGQGDDDQFPLKIAVSEIISERSQHVPNHRVEIEAFRKIKIDGIITTNYDRFLEEEFPDYETYIGQERLMFGKAFGVAEIFKIHGCISDPKTIIFTKEDYDRLAERNSYLLAKLLTIFVDNPIIFIGYSITDTYIQKMFRSILDGCTVGQISEFAKRIIVVDWTPDPVDPSIAEATIPIGTSHMGVTLLRVNSFLEIFETLGELKRTISAAEIRKLKEHIVELIKGDNPKIVALVEEFNLGASPIPDPKLSQIRYAGITASGPQPPMSAIGYDRMVNMIDLIKDVLELENTLDPKSVIEKSISSLQGEYFPVFKFISVVNGYENDGNIRLDGLPRRVVNLAKRTQKDFYPQASYLRHRPDYQGMTFAELLEKQRDTMHRLVYLHFVKIDNLNELLSFLKDVGANYQSLNSTDQSLFKKAVCYYDWLAFSSRQTDLISK